MTSLMSDALSRFGIPLVEFGLTWWIQSTILLLVGLAAAAWFRNRGPAVTSMIYRVTLLAVLACPVVTQVLSISGISLLAVDLGSQFSTSTVTEISPSIEHIDAEFAVDVDESGNLYDLSDADLTIVPFQTVGEVEQALPMEMPDAVAHAPPIPPLFSSGGEVISAPTESTALPTNINWSLLTAIGLLVVWGLGVTGFSICLLSDVIRIERLRRKSADGCATAVHACSQVASRLGVRSPRVLSSPFLNSPCLLGHWRPVVLLPEETPAATLHEVFLHELAHLRRGDWLWSLVGRATRVILWCQPLLWMVLRRSSIAAEEVCDDYVLQFGGNRHEYLRQLVEIAERTLPQPALAGVAMVSFQSKLGQRAKRILDTTRVLSTSTRRWIVCVSFVAMLVITAFVGMINVGRPPSVLADEPASPLAAEEQSDNAQAESAHDIVQVSGTVIGPDGRPMAGARVCTIGWIWSPGEAKIPFSETVSDAFGKFTISYRKSQINRNIGQLDQWKNTSVLAMKPGYGPDAVTWRKLENPADAKLRLAHDDVPIEGEVVDLEGRPVAGVRVKVVGIAKAKNDDLTPWIEAKKNGADSYDAYRQLDGSIPEIDGGIVDQTDQAGRFQLRGIGRERVASIVLEGPTIARTSFQVMTRLHEPITREEGRYFAETKTTYGAKFRRTVSPTLVIRGVVRDAESKQPLSGVRVESWRLAGTRIASNRVLRAESNGNGEYELVGMPKGDGNVILANPKDGQPYLMRNVDVPNPVGLGPVNVDIELHRGVVIRGRVTDKKTGKGVVARLHYLPFLDNEFAQATPEFDEHGNANGFQTRYESKSDGSYELIGLPGRAIVGVESVGHNYRTGVGVEEIKGRNEHGHYGTYNNPIMPSEKWPNTLVEINPSADAESIDLDIELDPGESLTINMVDEAGEPVTGVHVHGIAAHGYYQEQEGASFQAVAFRPDETRTVVIHHRKRNIGQVIRARASEGQRQVTLEPCATVKGRLVDEDGEPIVGIGIRVDLKPGGDFSKHLERMTTDREGRFIHRSIVPGTQYSLYAEGAKIGFRGWLKLWKQSLAKLSI